MKIAIITGGSRGLGRALAEEYCHHNFKVIIIARSSPKFKHSNLISHFGFDLSNIQALPSFFNNILLTVLTHKLQKITLINNAASLGDITALKNFDIKNIPYTVNLNLVAPMLLISILLKNTNNLRCQKTIFNITSSAANNPKHGMSTYSATKAALDMLTKTIAIENLNNPEIVIASIDPGIMDTEMQKQIRRSSIEDFPSVDRFINYHQNGNLIDPIIIAKEIYGMDTSNKFNSGDIISIEDTILLKNKR